MNNFQYQDLSKCDEKVISGIAGLFIRVTSEERPEIYTNNKTLFYFPELANRGDEYATGLVTGISRPFPTDEEAAALTVMLDDKRLHWLVFINCETLNYHVYTIDEYRRTI